LITAATVAVSDAVDASWDAVVVGAGPAGSFAARELAICGRRVLLLDRQEFPRPKVCGGCLNGRTLALLDSVGLGGLPAALGGQPLERFELRAGGCPVELPMAAGMAVSRTALDAALILSAIESGADFLPGTRATLGGTGPRYRQVRLPDHDQLLEARLVVVADGLGGSFLAGRSKYRSKPEANSRIGAGAEVLDPAGSYPAGVIHMAVDRSGYAGVAKVEGEMLSVAAALDPHTVRSEGLAGAIGHLLARRGLPPVDTAGAQWRGTAALTRRAPTVALERVFLIGDAAGYVEPFTGEGISWALETARTATSLAAQGIDDWQPDLIPRWRRLYRRRITQRQRWCRTLAWGLRRPALMHAGARLLGRAPRLATPLMAHLNATPAGERN